MAAAQEINISNYDTLLVESSQGRSGTPDGNVYFDVDNDRIELITREDLAQVDLGGGLEDNPLTDYDGITMQAIYAFERLRRRTNTSLRTYKHGAEGRFKQAGAFAFVNGIKLASNGNVPDRSKIRGSGFVEFAASGNGETDVDRIYFGARSLNPIDAASQPYSLLPVSLSESDRQAATPTDFVRTGPVNEVVQVFGSTAHGDAGAGDFDFTTRPLIIDVRPFGRTYGETNSQLAGISELGGYSSGFGIGDAVNDDNNYDFNDIITTPVAPFTGMSYTSYDTPQVRSGFTTADGSYDVIISNTGNGSLLEVIAFLDAIMTLDTDQDADVTNTYLPKRGAPLYTKDAAGRFVTKQGIHIDGLSTADQQSIVQTDNAGSGKVYPFFPTIRISVSDAWANDANGWAQAMYVDGAGSADFETSTAVIVDDSSGNPVVFTSADVQGTAGGYYLEFAYAYDTNTQAGLSAGVDKEIIVLVEGDGGSEAERGTLTITRSTLITTSILSAAETNLA